METILKRKKFEARAEVKLPDLFLEAKGKLGYNPQVIVNTETSEARRKQELEVAAALDSLGIEPLDKQSVDVYQHDKVSAVVRRGASPFVRYMHRTGGENIVTVLGVAGIALLAVLVGLTLTFINDKTYQLAHPTVMRFLWEAWLIFPVAWTVLMIARHKRTATYSASWTREWLESYRQPVPEFALARALEVKQVLPSAKFIVETLVEQQHGVRTEFTPKPDPFLVLVHGDVRAYLDVWDEPKFEGRRTV